MHLSREVVHVVADYLAIFVVFLVPAVLFLHELHMQARRLLTQYDLIVIRNDRLTNRAALHLARGGGFMPPPTP